MGRSKPRTADYGMQVLSRVLAYGVDPMGVLNHNACEGIKRLYSSDRSEIIWTANLVWAIANQGLTTAKSAPAHTVKHFLSYRAFSGTAFSFGELIRHVHLTQDEVLAFIIFISLTTGLPIESVEGLQAECLTNEARGYADLHYVKRRHGPWSHASDAGPR